MLLLKMACFTCFGLLLVLIGGNQSELARALSIDLAQSGLLVSAFTLGAGIGIVGAGPIFDRAARRPLFLGALLWVALVLLTTGSNASYHETLLRLVAVGLGAGAYNTVINASLAERYANNSAGPMALVHGCATIGAIAAAPLFGWISSQWHFSRSFQLVGAVHLVLALGGAALRLDFGVGSPARATKQAKIAWPALLPFLGIAFAYIGVEGMLTVFAMPYAQDALGLDVSRGRWAISALWAGVLLGRLGLYARREKRPGRTTLLVASMTAFAVLIVGALWRPYSVEIFFGTVGLAIGALYPLTMTMIGASFASARGTAAGLAGGAGAVGGVVVPWCAGVLGDRVGAASTVFVAATMAGLLVLCAACLPRSVQPVSESA